ncbi:ubiquitin-like protein [Favolaschia claudopus]|uniref:Ubiquitin-like protein n=1 Tax=Favolaschia claudopus TaxID=2862362 RepID=A0AAV9ZAV2_9AGAR
MTAATSEEDVKPDVTSPKIRITVQFNGTQLTFAIKRNKPLSKVLDTFCEKANVDRSQFLCKFLSSNFILTTMTTETLRFNYDGTNIRDEDTADDLEMDDEDAVIDGQIFQVCITIIHRAVGNLNLVIILRKAGGLC